MNLIIPISILSAGILPLFGILLFVIYKKLTRKFDRHEAEIYMKAFQERIR